MINEFLTFSQLWKNDKSKTVNKNAQYLKSLKNIKLYVQSLVDSKQYIVKCSCGNGNRNVIPWLAVFDKDFTTSAQRGIYVAILFTEDLQGFYLCLTQGITLFRQLYKHAKFKNAKIVSNALREYLSDSVLNVFTDQIDLKSKNDLAKGYEATTSVSMYFDLKYFKEITRFETSLAVLMSDYSIISTLFKDRYEPTIKAILNSECLAIEKKESTIHQVSNNSVFFNVQRVVPKIKKTKEKHNSKKPFKVDLEEQLSNTRKNKFLGDEGEKHVYQHELTELKEFLESFQSRKVIHWAKEDDSKGYDIESFMPLFDEVGDVVGFQTKYIEVKTTNKGFSEPFYLSENEKNFADQHAEQYYIYRVYKDGDGYSLAIIKYSDIAEESIKPSQYKIGLKL